MDGGGGTRGGTDGARAGAAGVEDPGAVRRRRLRAAPLLLPVAIAALGAFSRRWIADDGLINVHVVENLVGGRGFTFAPGIRAETSTSALWVLFLAVAQWVTPVSTEALAVWGGVAASLGGLGLALLAAHRHAGRTAAGIAVPFGLLAYAAYDFTWDFASSGLENGAVTLWLGAAALVVLRPPEQARAGGLGRAVLLGLGPLLRPDLALVSAVLLLSDLRAARGPVVRRLLPLAAAVALPVAFLVFRSGYFGAVVPNTGLAKEGTALRPGQGVEYLVTSLVPSGALAMAAVAAGVALLCRRGAAGETPGAVDPEEASAVGESSAADLDTETDSDTGIGAGAGEGWRWSATLALAGLVHLAYVVLVGGDFMMGRMLLPGLFLLAAAMGATRVPDRLPLRVVAAAGVVLVVALSLVTPPTDAQDGFLVDERASYVRSTGRSHPLSGDDYRETTAAVVTARSLDEAGPGTLVIVPSPIGSRPPIVATLRADVAARTENVVVVRILGSPAVAAGPESAVLDPIGLADPLAAHQRLLERGRPGHEKSLPPEWYVAWLADPEAPLDERLDPDAVAAARHALSCGLLAELVDATTTDLTWRGFARNVRRAAALTSFRFHPDPRVAAHELCP